jgi:hypothetical protein
MAASLPKSRRPQGAAARKRMVGGERQAKSFAMDHMGRHPTA